MRTAQELTALAETMPDDQARALTCLQVVERSDLVGPLSDDDLVEKATLLGANAATKTPDSYDLRILLRASEWERGRHR